jgi:hypothetical protein
MLVNIVILFSSLKEEEVTAVEEYLMQSYVL